MNETLFPGKKIIVLINSRLIGGHEMQVKCIITDFIAASFNVLILCPNEEVNSYFSDTGAIVQCVPFNVNGKIWKQVASRGYVSRILSSYLSDHNDVLVSGGSIEAVIGPIMAVRKINTKTRIVAYVPMYIDRSLTHGWVGHIYNCFLDTLAKVADEYLTVNKIQAFIIRNRTGVPTKYLLNRVRPQTKPAITYGPRLVYIGRFDDQQKDITGLIKLLDHPDNPYSNLILIGDGPDRKIVLDSSNKTRYLNVDAQGWLSSTQIDEMIGKEDVLILNSRWEGEPLVVREFLGKGLTCIARDIDGVRGLIHKNNRYQNQSELIYKLNEIYHKKRCLVNELI